ncbi:heavy metal translocating P-type ATPase [Desulfothermus okinawensis JCM 13304]
MENYSCTCNSCSCELDSFSNEQKKIVLMIVGCVYLITAFFVERILGSNQGLYLYIIAYIFLGYDVLMVAFKNFFKGLIFDEMFLMTVATLGAFFISAYLEACIVMLFYKVGEFLQEKAINKSRKTISSLVELRPYMARVIKKDREVLLAPEKVNMGEIIEIMPGERVPLDGEVVEGESFVDTSSLTGEMLPKRVYPGKEILSGFVNGDNVIKVRVTRPYDKSTIYKVIELIERSAEKKASVEKLISRLAKIYTPFVVVLALCIACVPPILSNYGLITLSNPKFSAWFYRGLVFLVISCPCALVLSIPLGFFAGIGGASRKGILVKGANYLELISKVNTIVWDKTGTLTHGNFHVQKVVCFGNKTEEQVLKIASALEAKVNHPIGSSIIEDAKKRGISVEGAQDVQVVRGKGVKGRVQGEEVLLGNINFLEENGIFVRQSKGFYPYPGTQVFVVLNGKIIGAIFIEDELKPEARKAIEELSKIGVKRHILLTGDVEEVAKKVSDILGIKEFFARLLPHDKVSFVEDLIKNRSKDDVITCVGDGINDAPMLRIADVGIAMGKGGVDIAMESADVVLMHDSPMLVKDAVLIGKKTMGIIWQNIGFVLGVKFLILGLGSVGWADMWMAIFADVGVALLAVLNSLRAFGTLKIGNLKMVVN